MYQIINEKTMIKIYRYNQLRNTVKLDIISKGGVRGTLVFDEGNVLAKDFPTVTVKTEFWQEVIEGSKLFKSGLIKLVQTIKDDGEDTAQDSQEGEFKEEPDITTPQQAIEYVANNFGERAMNRNMAVGIAKKHGVKFPNLGK